MEGPAWLDGFDLRQVERIDVGLEGDWSGTVVSVWRADGGAVAGMERVVPFHARYRHAVELYLADGWIGVHCFVAEADGFRFDRGKAKALVARVAAAHGGG